MRKIFIYLFFLSIFTPLSAFATYFNYNWTYDQDLINSYIKKNKSSILKNIKPIYIKCQKHKDFIYYVAKKYDVPVEIFAIPAIESAYNKKARSPMGAVGMWQFMEPTAKEFGLTITNKKDERKNWKKSTVSGVKYIKYLAEKNFNGDYELAILAYNAGIGTVRKSMKRMNNNNAWYLIKNDPKIPKESKEYLIKFIIYSYYFDYLDYNISKIKK